MKFQLLTVFVSLVIFGALHINGDCPGSSQAVTQINACFSELKSLTDVTKGPITAAQLNNYCSSSARNTEIQCAENLIKECRRTSSTARRIIDKAVNINGIRSSVKIMCNNTQIVAEKQDCIRGYQTTVTSCITRRDTSYNTRIQSIKTEANSKGVEWLEDELNEELCEFVGEMAVCQRLYGQNCGREIGDVFDALTHASRPPVCDASMGHLTSSMGHLTSSIGHLTSSMWHLTSTSNPLFGTGVMENVNLILLITLAFVAVVKGNP